MNFIVKKKKLIYCYEQYTAKKHAILQVYVLAAEITRLRVHWIPVCYTSGPQSLGHRLVPVCGSFGTGPYRKNK